MSVYTWAIIENIVTLIVIATIIVGVYALGGGGYGFWALMLAFNLNSVSSPKKSKIDPMGEDA